MATIVSQKVPRSHNILFITACAQNVLLQCEKMHHECKRQTLTPLTNSRLNNLHFTRECSDSITVSWPKLQSFVSSFFLMLHAKNY